MLTFYCFVFIVGLILLAWSAERFVSASATIASHFHIPPVLIGISIVALGTSIPEIFVAIIAVFHQTTTIAVGNAIGSNIANLGLVLGFTALITPIKVQSNILRREFPILLVVMALVFVLMLDLNLDSVNGIILLLGAVAVIFILITIAKKSASGDPLSDEYQQQLQQQKPISYAWGWIFLGIILLTLSAQMVVFGAITIARFLGVSELFIGLTLVAVGTSLPEIAVTVVSASKRQFDIAIGHILGSNIFNLLIALAIPALFAAKPINMTPLLPDMAWMFGLTLLVYLACYGYRRPGRINRVEGAILLSLYLLYIIYLSVVNI